MDRREAPAGYVRLEGPEAIGLIRDILSTGMHVRIRVTGGSMEPCLSSGDTVVLKQVAPETISPGDLVFFMDQNNQPILHRCIRKHFTPEGKLQLQTKGDCLAAYDEPFAGRKLLGKVIRVEKRTSRKVVLLESFPQRVTAYGIAWIQRTRAACRAKLHLLWKPV